MRHSYMEVPLQEWKGCAADVGERALGWRRHTPYPGQISRLTRLRMESWYQEINSSAWSRPRPVTHHTACFHLASIAGYSAHHCEDLRRSSWQPLPKRSPILYRLSGTDPRSHCHAAELAAFAIRRLSLASFRARSPCTDGPCSHCARWRLRCPAGTRRPVRPTRNCRLRCVTTSRRRSRPACGNNNASTCPLR